MTGFSHSASRKKRLPGYLLHKPSGHARVRIEGKDHYLGPYGSVESRALYGELIAAHLARQAAPPTQTRPGRPSDLTINELCLAFLRHAAVYHGNGGKPTAEYRCYKSVIRPLVELYGSAPVSEFGPLALKAVRQKMVEKKSWRRSFVNKAVSRIRHAFKFGVENELVEPAVLQKLQAVAPLLAGRTEARDYSPRRPVPQHAIDKVKAVVSERTAGLTAKTPIRRFSGAGRIGASAATSCSTPS